MKMKLLLSALVLIVFSAEISARYVRHGGSRIAFSIGLDPRDRICVDDFDTYCYWQDSYHSGDWVWVGSRPRRVYVAPRSALSFGFGFGSDWGRGSWHRGRHVGHSGHGRYHHRHH